MSRSVVDPLETESDDFIQIQKFQKKNLCIDI